MSSYSPDSLCAQIVSLHCRTTLTVSSPNHSSWKTQSALSSVGSACLSDTGRMRGLLPTLAALQPKQMQKQIQCSMNKPIKKIVNITYNNSGYILRRKPHFHGIIVRTFPHRLLQLWPKYGINSSVLDYRNENFLVPTKLLNFNNIARILNTVHFNQQCLLSYALCLSHEIDVC